MVKCKTCGQEISKSAKICPHCGVKQKKHIVLGVGEQVELNGVIVTLVSVTENKGANYMTPSDGKVFVVSSIFGLMKTIL